MFYRTFEKAFPKSQLIFKELQTEEIIAGIQEGTLDFGIVVTPLHEEQIVENILYYEPLVGYIPPSHPLHSQKSIQPADLNSEDLLLLKEGHCFRNNVLSLCEPAQLKAQPVRLDSGSLDTLVKLANEGYGMTLLPALHAEDLPAEFQKNVRYFEK